MNWRKEERTDGKTSSLPAVCRTDPDYSGEENKDRPDIAIFFSTDPCVGNERFDIVIIILS